ncbi:GGDEF domain-containing protein [Thiomicrorhabdus sp. 6S3-12]|uniref:GGDEF domain-containing protein n=1 Tax=Thiomicrorhabdus sp. 6S3-12 TaxID=2819681 RepID=UPI001AAD0BFB|nr:GGDEF domain-containing protein [Thiomicrorhabdus sp. 6S3-12]MBO1924090.1 GGDEF domain-containing protein [Thiomicrorhabdus sp. 6S3-12]
MPIIDTTKSLNQYFVANLYTPANNQLLDKHHALIEACIEQCIETFYEILLPDPIGAQFLSSAVVETHLKTELKRWLLETLSPQYQEEDHQTMILKHRHVGAVHARVGVPMTVVNHAMSIIKNRFYELLYQTGDLPDLEKIALYRVLNNLLDSSLALINESYIDDHVTQERAAQEYRSRSNAHEIAIEVERIKASLFNWISQLMSGLLTSSQTSHSNLQNQEFALWIRHKIGYACQDDKTTSKIKQLVDELQEQVDQLPDSDPTQRRHTIQQITELGNECGWLLGQISERNIDNAAREDTLTTLIERRFLAPILKSETKLAINSKRPYSIIMLDIDNFKQINDVHGHQAGDQVLSQLGLLIKRTLRITDYAFRYGGEEFLLLLPETPVENAQILAQKLLKAVRQLQIEVSNNHRLQITISLGLAPFNEHPDFEQVIKRADEKLYQAKHNGKDRYEA